MHTAIASHDPGFRVQGLGFEVLGSGFRVQGSGFRVQGSGFRVQGSGFRVQGSGFRVHGSSRRFQGSGFKFQASGSMLQGGVPSFCPVDLLHNETGLRLMRFVCGLDEVNSIDVRIDSRLIKTSVDMDSGCMKALNRMCHTAHTSSCTLNPEINLQKVEQDECGQWIGWIWKQMDRLDSVSNE